ncbi:MAG: 16S rRNA (adenine(1518)-N(6)/adenine(1519)-N(6))-dimethyltransferase RsmA [Bacteroidia bacterium]|nr:16S rRNA (adenine(1518)-N(6)/adenine(1519)-N(6))-dimethyltransferase RsmA [Bacteroidia bacterium]MDW8089610.1 16S rRNA (adenine(1518)-N(6)/adenine(1519)-N(6))-dimethyltransferase RsmA [Bacteroidia bacterium]
MPRYDQHFLRASAYARKIVAAVQAACEETIVEIGPGRGALTRYLLELPQPYIGVEIDPLCLQQLKAEFPLAKAQWVQEDFLRWPLPEQALYIVSNLPYSISGPVLGRILGHRRYIRGGVLMLQAEVAQRLYAVAGTRAYGRLSVLFQSVYGVERVLRVPPGAFSPMPRVWSEVIRFERRPHIAIEDWEDFAEFVRLSFRQPRRTLANNLKALGRAIPEALGQRRPHQLPVATFLELWRQIQK